MRLKASDATGAGEDARSGKTIFFDALDDYGEIQKRRIKLSKTPKRPFEIDDKFNVLKKAINHD